MSIQPKEYYCYSCHHLRLCLRDKVEKCGNCGETKREIDVLNSPKLTKLREENPPSEPETIKPTDRFVVICIPRLRERWDFGPRKN